MEWISVDDRLPVEGDEVFVWTDNGYCFVAIRQDSKWFDIYDDEELIRITHWFQPSPPITKE